MGSETHVTTQEILDNPLRGGPRFSRIKIWAVMDKNGVLLSKYRGNPYYVFRKIAENMARKTKGTLLEGTIAWKVVENGD